MAAADAFLASLLGGVTGGPAKSLTGDDPLDAFAKTAAQNSIYNQIAAPVLSTKFDTRTWSPGESFGVNLGQAFLGGLMGKLGERDVANQYAAAAKVLPDLYRSPNSIAIPEGVNEEAFGALKLAALRENAQREKQLQDSVIANVFTRNPEFSTMAPETAAKVGLSELGAALQQGSRFGEPGELQKFLAETGGDETLARQLYKDKKELELKEKQQAADINQTLDFIDSKFDRAKQVTGATAALPFTSSGQELTGLGDSVILQIDKLLGREMNSDVRERVLGMAPKWYDDEKTVDLKKDNLKQFIKSLSKAPIGERAAIAGGMLPTLEAPKKEAASKPQITREQAIAELARRRGAK